MIFIYDNACVTIGAIHRMLRVLAFNRDAEEFSYNMLNIRCFLTIVPIAVLYTANSGLALAEETNIEEVLVTAQPTVVESVSTLKEYTTGILDAITNDQIERLPDHSFAEALDRVPGVASVAYNSQTRWITLRGLDARYNSTDIDGNPIWSSSRNNRGTQLDVFPTSAAQQIQVYKAVTPEVDANSIGGHISIRTLRAFDGGPQPYFKVKGQYGHYENSGMPEDEEPTYKLAGTGKFTFGDSNQYGVVLGFDFQRHEYFNESGRVKNGYEDDPSGFEVPTPQIIYDASIYQTEIRA